VKARRPRQSGFSLIEALAALVLIASVGMALYGWINSNLITLQRVKHHADKAVVVRNVLAWFKQLNPMEQPSGTTEIAGWRVEWDSRELRPPTDNVGHPGGIGLFQVALYDVRVRIGYPGENLEELALRQVGYRQVRQPELLF
jgi:general secretion pathway protein I